ncbi:MAG TPA: hypothetical protein VJN29_19705 [Intrasporangium sp.]|uniref:hypothetical protein n=1 Tax=Intrasporangium sp. TaxID=1925024 RepID=UPI002B4A9B71|nr:hypothetical protein [Intrasporangium sp.]HKX69449.1 hypothetical protein [Intrasporangium sp.]
MKLDKAVELVTEAEEDLAEKLVKLAGRHATEHDVYHLGHQLAERSRGHLARLKPFAEQLGAKAPDGETGAADGGPADRLRRMSAAVLGRSEATGMMLLLDLRDAYLVAQRVEISWVILLQAARAARRVELENLVTTCHEEAEGTAKWLRTHIKVSAPQVLATG